MRSGWDAVVVGASTSGLHAATRLAQEGLRTLVLERKSEAERPGRTWIVTDRLTDFLGPLPPRVGVHRTRTMELYAGRASAAVPLDPPDWIVERSALLEWLGERAAEAGARVRTGMDVTSIQREGEGFRIRIRDRDRGRDLDLWTRRLVGADGTRSAVADTFGAGPQEAVPVVQARVGLSPGYDPGVTRVWFQRVPTRFFYWLIPESPTEGVAGLVPETPATAREDLEEFLRAQELQPLEYQGAMIPLHRPSRRVSWRFGPARVLLVGDAAAQVKVTTVGGVVSGIWGAEAAARALVRGTSYRKELRGLSRELWLHDLIRWSMDRFDQETYERLLGMLNEELTGLLSRRSRDSMAGAVWRLLRAQPRILSLGLRSLVRPHRPGGAGSVPPRPHVSPRPAPAVGVGAEGAGD